LLRNQAKKVIDFPKKLFDEINEFKVEDIKKAVVFPFNKEIHSVIRYKEMLPFYIEKVFDFKYSGNVGKKIGEIINDHNSNVLIENFEKVNWKEPFDTFILGHINKHLLFKKNLLNDIISNCKKYNKRLYSFDLVADTNDVPFFCANENSSYHINSSFGKLRNIGKPILGVMGTSSRQGKFTVQLSLRKSFIASGYKVGQLGTEPSALLFGFNQMHTNGYNTKIDSTADEEIIAINRKMGYIEDTDPDIIIIGTQSLTVPMNYSNIGHFPITQYLTMLACQPMWLFSVLIYLIRMNIFYVQSNR
jgi:Uncharacterized conserved protein